MATFSLNKELEELREFNGGPAEFLERFLKVKTHLAQADAGAIISISNGKVGVVAASYKFKQPPTWLEEAKKYASQTLRTRQPFCFSCNGRENHLVYLLPFPGGERPSLTVIVGSKQMNIKELYNGVLGVSYSMLDHYESRMTLKQRQGAVQRVYSALDIQLIVNKRDSYHAYSIEVCNELAARWSSSRVSFSLLKGSSLRVEAMSHLEKFSHKSKNIRDLEDAMEESLDQDREITYPPIEGARYIYRQSEQFSKEHDQSCLLSLPMRHKGEVCGVLLLERRHDNPFTFDDLEALRLIVDLLTPRLLDLKEKDSFWGHLPKVLKSPTEFLLGSQHTLAKLSCLAFMALFFFLANAKGTYKVEGTFRLEPIYEKSLSAPFEGVLATVNFKPGDAVKKGQVLAQMDILDLKLKLAELESQKLALQKEYTMAVDESQIAKAQMAQARLKGIRAEMTLTQIQIERGQIKAPIAGFLTSEDLSKSFRAPVQKGDELFIISDTAQLKGVAYIPEDQIADLKGQDIGEIAISGYADKRLPIEVETLGSVAEVKDNINVFRVELKLKEKSAVLLSGMEGLVKIDAGERLYISIWTRKAMNWLRMYFWI